MEKEYIEAIQHVNNCILTDNRETWWPTIVKIEGNYKTHSINGIEMKTQVPDNAFSDSYANSLLRLLKYESPCELFAYPVGNGIIPIDIIVGFMSEDKSLILGWDKTRVFPMIGMKSGYLPDIPENTKWIIGASLNKDYRKAVALYGNTKTMKELKEDTITI